MYINKFPAIFTGLLLSFFICPFFYSADPSGNQDDSVIAKFANYNITLGEFRIAYFDLIKRPNVFDSKEMREKFLNELIATKLIAVEAKKAGFDKDTLFNYKVNAYKNKCMREAHYDTIIRPKISVEEKEIEDAYRFTQEERNLSHLFFDNKEAADSAYDCLLKGEKFEDMARRTFSDSLLKNNGGNLGWVQWEQLDFDIADAAFKLLPDVFTKPIKSQYGYHILKIVDFRKKPLITNFEYALQKQKVKYLVEFKKGQQLSFEYISKLLKDAKIILYPKTVQYLEKNVSRQFKRKPDIKNAGQEFQLSEEEINRVEVTVWDSKSEIIASVNGKDLTIGDFLSNLNYIPYEIVYSDFSKTLDYSIRDFIITNEAYALGLENEKKVLQKTNLFMEYFLKLGLSRKLVASVNVTEDEMKKYYNDYRPKFKDASFDTCRAMITDLLTRQKKINAIPDFVNKLKNGIEITRNIDLLNKYYDAVLKGDIR